MTLHIATVSRASSGVEGPIGQTAARSAERSGFEASQVQASAEAGGFRATVAESAPGPAPTVAVTAGPATGPMETVSSGVLDSLEAVARRRAEMRAGGATSPESALQAARESLLPGPAELRPRIGEGPAAMSGPEVMSPRDAISALSDTFDYAIETHVVVKSISQFSSSANSLLKTQ